MKRVLPSVVAVFAMFAASVVGCSACPTGSDSPDYRAPPPYSGTGKPPAHQDP